MIRQAEFRRNENLEGLLKELNNLLAPAEEKIISRFRSPKYPVILVVGAPRSGTTLMMQWLASLGKLAYPTNILSRFYGAPYIGAKIQQLLASPEYNFRDEILDFSGEVSFVSVLGKTKGALAPNEFWYFWRRFTPNAELEFVNEKMLEKMDSKRFLAELAAIESIFDKPFVMKGLILQFNIPFLASMFEKVLFVFTRRNPLYNIQSLLGARIKFYGTIDKWYSAKPKEYEMLKDMAPYEQVAGQVYYTNREIEGELGKLEQSRSLEVRYEEFCENPLRTFGQIADKLSAQGYEIDSSYTGPGSFKAANELTLSGEELKRVMKAYKEFSGEELNL
ncbi:MAG: sulfotransferase [Candidatus Sulfobium sp.]